MDTVKPYRTKGGIGPARAYLFEDFEKSLTGGPRTNVIFSAFKRVGPDREKSARYGMIKSGTMMQNLRGTSLKGFQFHEMYGALRNFERRLKIKDKQQKGNGIIK